MKFKLLFPRFINKKETGGGWVEPWMRIGFEFNTQVIYNVDDERDWLFALQFFGFGLILYSSMWGRQK